MNFAQNIHCSGSKNQTTIDIVQNKLFMCVPRMRNSPRQVWEQSPSMDVDIKPVFTRNHTCRVATIWCDTPLTDWLNMIHNQPNLTTFYAIQNLYIIYIYSFCSNPCSIGFLFIWRSLGRIDYKMSAAKKDCRGYDEHKRLEINWQILLLTSDHQSSRNLF